MIKPKGHELWRPRTIPIKTLLVLFSFATPVLGQNPTSSQSLQRSSSTALNDAHAALEHGNSGEAIRILSDYLETHPVDYLALATLGEIYEREGQLEKAEPLLERAAKASKGSPQIQMEWAVVLARLHEYKKAQRALVGVSAPTDREEQIEFYRLKGSVALGLGDAKAAASEMEEALRLKPEDLPLMMATAATQLQAGNAKRAAQLAGLVFADTRDATVGMMLLEAQIAANEDFHSTLDSLRISATNGPDAMAKRQHLAELLVSHGKFADSLEDFQRVVEIAPNRADPLFNLALAQYKAGRLGDALASAEKCKALADTPELEDLMGDIQEAKGDNLAAVKSYQAAVALAPSEERYRLSLALEFIRHKSFDAAKVTLEQTAELYPDSWRVQFALGMVEYFEGRDEKASPILLRAASLSPQPALALKYVGDIQLERAAGPGPEVISELCRYADLHPKETAMQYYCGALLFRRDYAAEDRTNLTEILRRLNAGAKALPDDAGAHCQLGRVYRWVEKWPEALRESQACVRLDPESAQGHYRLAQIYQHEGQEQHAKEEMNLYQAASKRVADENALRDETIKTFLLTIEDKSPTH